MNDEPTTTQTRGERARTTGFQSRFTAIYIALAVIGGIGLGAFVVVLARPSSPPEPAWSAFEPNGSALAVTRQIANRVTRSYRSRGNQLVAAFAGPPTVGAQGTDGASEVPVRVIAVRPDTSTGQAEESEVAVEDAAKSYQFVLCGLGRGCSIPDGVASPEREALLRREALELALYTLKYVDSLESVTIFLPPRATGDDTFAAANVLFLRRRELRTELAKPLRLHARSSHSCRGRARRGRVGCGQPAHAVAALHLRVPAGARPERRADALAAHDVGLGALTVESGRARPPEPTCARRRDRDHRGRGRRGDVRVRPLSCPAKPADRATLTRAPARWRDPRRFAATSSAPCSERAEAKRARREMGGDGLEPPTPSV